MKGLPMRPLTRAERRELTALRTVPLPMAPEQIDRYCHLSYRDEQDFHAAMDRMHRWERRRPALRTLADVLFWLCTVPLWVLAALAGGWLGGALLIGVLWLALRCDWTFLPWTEPR
jgi:hypothetical protein